MSHSRGLLAYVLGGAADQEANWEAVLRRWHQAAPGEQEALLHELARLHTLKNRCMDTASHDLRGDVAAIRGFAELLAEELPPAGSGQEYLGIITTLATKLLVAMHDLLDFRLLEQGGFVLRRREGDLAAMIRGRIAAWMAAAAAHGLTVRDELAALPPCFFDAERLDQVVEELLARVAQGAPAGSVVRLRLGSVAGLAEFVVEDEGLPVPEAELAQWFAADQAGSLALARRIVESHYGTLTVASLPGEGRRFAFTIPVSV